MSSHDSNQFQFWQLEPWPCLVIDNFLATDELKIAIKEIDEADHEYTIETRSKSRIEYDVLRSRVLWKRLYSASTIKLLMAAFQGRVCLDASNLIQIRRSNDYTPRFEIHNDYIENENTIVSFLYMSNGWAEGLGGEFLMYKHPFDPVPSAAITPALNRFIAFRTLPDYWHAVAKVRGWTRLSVMALWKFIPISDVTRPGMQPS